MQFELDKAIEILSRTPEVIAPLLLDLSGEWIRQNEGPNTWSPFDIIGHFIHGEKTDWIPRARLILESKGEPPVFTPFDRFAQFRESKGKTLNALMEEFHSLRTNNIKTLKNFNIAAADLDKKGVHPELGEVTLRQLLATWVTHDLNHIAQIARVMAKQYRQEVGPWIQYIGILR